MFSQSDVLGYVPAHGDLIYPERLIMMHAINEQNKPIDQLKQADDEDMRSELTQQEQSQSGLPIDEQRSSSTSPIDQHCLWYPTVRRTVVCLSKLFKCLDVSVTHHSAYNICILFFISQRLTNFLWVSIVKFI